MTAPASAGRPLGAHDPSALGEYTLLRRLGEGGMGTVYLGRSRAGRLVAVKVIRPEFAQVDEFRVRFVRETASAQRVARFCTAEVLDVDADGEMPYLVTEFVEGETLAQVVAETGPLTAANLERLAVGMAAALTAIHGAGIVHRDLKPGNVMLSPFGPRVIDFGIARASDAALGMTQIRVGTPAFMAPEQVLGEALTPALDVFAWGATVAYAGTGRLPFGDDADRLFYRILNGAPDLEGLRGNGFLHPIVERALAKDPAARPASNELLLSLLGGSGAGAAAFGDPEAAVTRAMVGWSPPADEPATVLPGPSAATAPSPPPPGPSPAPYDPPTAATVLPNWPQPTSSPPPVPQPQREPQSSRPTAPPPAFVLSPASGDRTSGGRAGAAPPVRPTDAPAFAGDTGSAPRAPRRRRGRIVAAVVAAAVVAALVVGGMFLFKDKGDGTPSAGGSSSPSTSASGFVAPAPLPESSALAVTTMVAAESGTASQQIVTLDTAGAPSVVLAVGSVAAIPVLAPNRKTIAYLSNGRWQVMAADGSGGRPLLIGAATDLTPCAGQRVAWSPDGTHIALCARGPSGDGLYIVDPVKGSVRHLPSQAEIRDPTWSPDGSKIVYWSNDLNGAGGPLFQLAVDGASLPQKLTDGVDSQPAFAPNGQHLTFRRFIDGSLNIVGTRSDGSGATFYNFTPNIPAIVSNPSYKPNQAGGEAIVFVCDRPLGTSSARLYTFDPADRPTIFTPVAGDAFPAFGVSWSSGPVFGS